MRTSETIDWMKEEIRDMREEILQAQRDIDAMKHVIAALTDPEAGEADRPKRAARKTK